MARHVYCTPDTFAAGIEQLVGDIPDKCVEGCTKAVSQSIRKGASELRSGAYGSGGRHEWSGEYMGGFSSAMTRGGATPAGEIGNKAKPGLVHLLEKGHVTLRGRRTGAFPHMAPAFDSISEDFVERVKNRVTGALG